MTRDEGYALMANRAAVEWWFVHAPPEVRWTPAWFVMANRCWQLTLTLWRFR